MIIYHVIPNLVVGGAQTALRNLIENLPEYEHRIWTFDNYIDNSWKEFHVTTVSIIQLLKNIINETSKKAIFHFHWYPPFKFKIPENKKFCSLVTIQDNAPCSVLGANIYVVSTHNGLIYVPSEYKGNSRIISPGIDANTWKNLNIPRKKGLLMRHSTIYPNKLSPTMILDMAKYNSEIFSWEIIGVGEKNYINSLKQLCNDFPSVKIASCEKINLRLNEAWLYVYHAPEGFEHFGLCFMEAMACGTPVITNDIIGGRAQIKNNYGFVCKNYEEMKLKVEYLYNHPEIYQEMFKNVSSLNFEKKQREYTQSYSLIYEELRQI
ncbi:glycosyltransferase [Candidatus Protochlamydia sp. W-9]|uniref:glycosyltransferase n=1 Tax=Candidatus Protochlamydia sp. W-9 TaxID=1785087 RepID=UPI00096AA56B|nr:glycosyltransferase [Candidatus Protochlamydia sp. W-9]